MRVVMTLLVRDEADVVHDTIRFHLAQGVDHVIAMDNLSEDGTTRILREHERLGHLTYLHQPSRAFHQKEWVTEMARLAWTRFRADWVVNNDADEFWVPREGTLADTLARVPPEVGVVRYRRNDLLPLLGQTGPWYDRMIARQVVTLNHAGAPIQPKSAHRGHPRANVGPGNHMASVPGLGRPVLSEAVHILHVPVRSFAQVERKYRTAGDVVRANPAAEIGVGWIRLHELQESGQLRAWFHRRALDAGRLRQGLVDATLVIDRRVQRLLHALDAGDGAGGTLTGPE